MGFVTARVGRQHQATIDRVHAALGPAVEIIENEIHARVGYLQLAVSNTSDMWQMVVDAHRPMFGQQDARPLQREGGRAFGTATITSSGVLVVINAQACKGRAVEVDKTLLHELTHAAQFNRPGARDLIMRSLANNYGITPMTEAEAAAANRRVDTDEREAERMERHHRLLAQSIA